MVNGGITYSVENEIDDVFENHNDNLIQSYLDAHSACAYKVDKTNLQDVFGGKFSKDEIDKVILFNMLKNPELFSS